MANKFLIFLENDSNREIRAHFTFDLSKTKSSAHITVGIGKCLPAGTRKQVEFRKQRKMFFW